MGKSFSRNRDDENYRDNMKGARQATKQDRHDRHRNDDALDQHMERDDAPRGQPTRDPRQSKW